MSLLNNLDTLTAQLLTQLVQGVNKTPPADFNVAAFTANLKDFATNEGQKIIKSGGPVAALFANTMQEVVENSGKTLEAMQTEKDEQALRELQKDLVQTMPAIIAAAKSTLATQMSSDTQAALDDVWNFVLKSAVTAGQALLFAALASIGI